MASGEHVVEDLFGFAELTGESTTHSFDKRPDDSQKFHFEKEKIKRDTNEVVVPMFFEKSGVKKYKVLARHQVEDDEDIKRLDSVERKSPNSEEQRKENICIDQRHEKGQKYKSEALGLVKKTKVRKIEKRKDNSIKDFKQSVNKSSLKGEFSKKHQVKFNGKKIKADKQRDKKLEESVGKEKKDLSNEINEGTDSNNGLQIKSSGENKANDENYNNSCATRSEDVSTDSNLEKQHVQNPLKIKCHVKLRRDPSIENFYKVKPDNFSKDYIEPELSDSSSKADEERNIKGKCLNRSSSFEAKPMCRQGSVEDISTKTADMVYNVDIKVRKSGRLQSAKCASRYRGDYGIRVDTYKQLMTKTTPSLNNCFETEERQVHNSERGDLFTEDSIESHVIIQSNNLHIEKSLDLNNRGDQEGVTSEELKSGMVLADHLKNEDIENKQVASDLNNEIEKYATDNHNSSSDKFTVIKLSVTDYGLTLGKNSLINAECVTDSANEKLTDNGNGICQEEGELSQESQSVVLNDRNMSREVKTNEIMNNTDEEIEDRLIRTQNTDLKINSSEETFDNSICEVTEARKTNFAQYDNKVIQTECSDVASEVPCSNMMEESKLCSCDISLTPICLCQTLVHNSVCIDNITKTQNEVMTSQKIEIGKKHMVGSQNSENTIGNVDESVEISQAKSKFSDRGHSHYVHSVGKSVNKIQNRIRGKKRVVDLSSELTENDISPERSPVKDPAKILECLRQRLFESAGANVVEADKATKQFESKLISSKQRKSMTDGNVTETVYFQERDKQVRDSDSASSKSGKSTPRCTTPRQEVGGEILEEVAKSLNVLHQAKRQSENVSKTAPTKRQRFEEKKFMLRSMMRASDYIDAGDTERLKSDDLIADSCNEKPVFVGRIAERTRSNRSSCESSSCSTEMCKFKVEINQKANDINIDKNITEKKDIEHDKTNSKLKPIKCSACGHLFKTKELLRKHFPCRIRQTRTWSQNKLRPNRAVKRNENGSKKFVCKLPKANKPEPSKSRPQLLTYRKTKFRRVKGKRRRKLYQLIQELIQKRNPAKWHHLSILYDDLSFKEQCLYKLGLICIGNAAEGLERYTAEDITLFEQHRAKEKWLKEDARTFVHSIPDTLKPLNDSIVSTDLSTDTQESDFFSPKHVINFPQENVQSKICDNTRTQVEMDCSRNRSTENESEGKTVFSLPQVQSRNEILTAPCYVEYAGIEEQETETTYEVTEEIETLGTLNACISFQEYHEIFRRTLPHMDIENNADGNAFKKAGLETFTSVTEGNKYLEVAQDLLPDTAEMIYAKDCTQENPLKKADVFEIVVKNTYKIDTEETNTHDQLEKVSQDKSISQPILIEEDVEYGSEFIEGHLDTSKPSTVHINSEKEESGHKEDSSEELAECSPNSSLFAETKNKEEYQSQYFDDRGLNDAELSRKPVAETNDAPFNNHEGKKELVHLSVIDVKRNESMKKAIGKYLAVPDIELYHQTAKIDGKFLAATPQTLKLEESSNDKIIDRSCTISRYQENFDSNVSLQACGRLKNDIVENVEQNTYENKDEQTPEIEKSYKVDKKEVNVISPVKGILKKACPKKEHEAVATNKQSSILYFDELTEKSPKKKKIDFKTYAKRKGLIKDSDTKSKGSSQPELHHEIKTNDSREGHHENDKECMRSEPNLEIEDDLLGRILDAVNLIDSIIEEQKEETDTEENMNTFSAITPEMAFEALIANEKAVNNNFENFAGKPYDIESEYSFTEVDEKNLNAENLCLTEISEMSDFNDFIDRGPTYLHITNKENIQSSENSKNEDLPSIYSEKNEELDKKGATDHISSYKEIHEEDNYDMEESGELRTKFNAEAQLLIAKEQTVDYGDMEFLESEIMIKEPKTIDCKMVTSVEKLDSIIDHNKTAGKVKEKDDIEDISVKENEMEYSESNTTEVVVQNVTNSLQTLDEKEVEDSENRYVTDAYTKAKENVNIEETDKCNTDEVMKSPGLAAKKGLQKINENTAIKESKRDFTIKYEMNGLVVKENLLTGDKNVVENSSPFRSSAESESNCDQSLSELDVSSNYDNDVSFDSNLLLAEEEGGKDVLKSPDIKIVSSSVTEKEAVYSTNIGCQIPSIVEDIPNGKPTNEQHILIENPRTKFSLDMHSEATRSLESDNTFDTEDSSVLEEKTTDSVDMFYFDMQRNIVMQSDLNGHDIQEVSSRNITDESLVDKKINFMKKISDDISVGSPPVLEKVAVSEESNDKKDDDTSSPGTEISIEGEPPLLEPQHFEKDTAEKMAIKTEHSSEKSKVLPGTDINEVKQDKTVRQERHFLDILSMVGTEGKDPNVFASFGNELEGNGLKQLSKTSSEELYQEDSTFNEDIGRHFSDVMSEPVETPRSPKSKLQFLFDNNESGDINLAQIKDVLSPFSVKGKKKSISKESLLKIKTSIANLLYSAENPGQNNPLFLKSDTSSNNTEKNNDQNNVGFNSEIENLCDESISEDVVSLLDSEPEQFNSENSCTSKSSVSDHILKMIDSLEDKGNVAENMSSLLGILAENLGFLGKQKVDLSSDSDYSYSEDTNLTGNSSTENTQKELIAEYLEEGEKPPSLDDISTANSLEIKDVIDLIKDKKEDSIEAFLVQEQIDDRHAMGEKESFTHISDHKCKTNTEKETISEMEFTKGNHVVDSDKHIDETEIEGKLMHGLDFESPDDSLSLSCDQGKGEKHKATTIFKSITELNSIETDEESVTDEPFDPVSMSARLSDLKVLSKDNNRWEFNSDYNSDEDKLDYYDSDYEIDFETQADVAEVSNKDSVMPNVKTGDKDQTDCVDTDRIIKQPSGIFENRDIGNVKDGGDVSALDLLTMDRVESDLLTQICVISKDSTNVDGKDEKLNEVKETAKISENVSPVVSKVSEHITDMPKSSDTVCDDKSDSKVSESIDDVSLNRFKSFENENSRTKVATTEPTRSKYRVDNIFASFENDIIKTAAIPCSDINKQEHVVGYAGDLNYTEKSDSQSLTAEVDPFSDHENDLSENETWESDICQDDSVTIASIIESPDKTLECSSKKFDVTSFPRKENDHLCSDTNTVESNVEGDLKLILEVDPLNECSVSSKEGNESIELLTDDSTDEKDGYQRQITFNDSLLSRIDEDTTETVRYEESTETDFCDDKFEVYKDKQKSDVKEDSTIYCSIEQHNFNDLTQDDLVEVNETEVNGISSDNISTLIKVNGSEDNGQAFEKSDSYIYQQNIVSDENEQTNKRRSTSLNVHDDYSDNFCESIAEKVKRKQRERSKSVCYNFNPWLYYSAAYVKEVTKPARKEFSVFRSSILEKRAREKSFSPDKDISCSTRKKRTNSVPKETKCEATLKNGHTKEDRSFQTQQKDFQIKPCSVLIPKLNEDVIMKYTRRKRKYEEDTTESRPPIKVTIKLSQILYPPPNSPYGSTSASSDNYRSGYESCSEESENDSLYETEYEKETIPKLSSDEIPHGNHDGKERTKTAEVIISEPLKIKIRTLCTKNNEDNQKSYDSVQRNDQVENFVKNQNGTSMKVNAETSSDGIVEELTESEVLQDIERECKKIKSSSTTEDNVLFYLSESDSDNEPKEYEKCENEDKGKHMFAHRVMSKSSVKAECGESDVDLSDSDTDSEIQEAIDKILNSKSSSDFSNEIVKNSENKQSTLKKGKTSGMKMIVSDLRLSESESEYESENYGRGIETGEMNQQQEKDSTFESIPLQNVMDKRSKNDCFDKQDTEDTKGTLQENSNIDVAEKYIKSKGETISCNFSNRHTPLEETDCGDQGSDIEITSKEIKQPLNESDFQSPVLDDSIPIPVEEVHNYKEKDPKPSNNGSVWEPLNMSLTSKNSEHVSKGSAYEKEKEKINREEKVDSLIEKQVKPYSDFESINVNLYSDHQKSKKRERTTVETLNDIESLNTISEGKSKKLKLSDERDGINENDHTDIGRADSNLTETGDHTGISMVDNKEGNHECHLQTTVEMRDVCIENKSLNDLKTVIENKEVDSEKDCMNVDCQESIDNGNGKGFDIPKVVSENNEADEVQKSEVSEEDSKQIENISAVKNLEEDIFQDIQPIHNATEDEMIYYAVELSDDLETSEAVVNLETVELIEGPIIIENNDTLEENVIDTNIIQSHVNDQFEISPETLNEQVVEILNEPKSSDETRINCALENMPQMENATVNNIKSKYLYGINEDSQSSTEVVEELVTEIVNDNTVIDIGHVSGENKPLYPSEVTSWEIVNSNEEFLDAVQNESENSLLVSGNARNEAANVIPSYDENVEVTSECAVENESSRSGPEKSQNSTVLNEKSCKSDDAVHPVLLETHLGERSINKTSEISENIVITDKEIMKTDYDLNSGDSSHCCHFVDNYTSPLNISVNCSDTRDLCSGQDGIVQVKSDNLSHGNDLLGADSFASGYSENVDNRMCVEPCHIKEDIFSGVIEGSNIVQELDHDEDKAMIVECCEDNGYIITQNVSNDDDDEDDEGDDDDAMDTE